MRDITQAELRHFTQKMNCPACEGELLSGPEGGSCVNFKCARCSRIWNLCFASGMGIFTGQLVQGDDYIQNRDAFVEDEEPPPIGWGRAAVTALIILLAMAFLIWFVYGFSPAE